MEYSQSKTGSELKINFKLNSEEWNGAVLEAYNKTKGKYMIPGFRKGKAPKKVIESIYGQAVFYDEAMNIAFDKAYGEYIDKEKDFEPVSRPDVSVEAFDEKGIEFAAVIFTKPEIKLGKYKGLEVTRGSNEVFSDEVDAEIEKARSKVARLVEVTDRAAMNGDHALIDYSGAVNGVKFEGGTAEKHDLVLGSNSFIPGFEEQVVGMKIGETKDLKVKFPDEYHSEELKGKEAVFTVFLHELKANELPEFNDEFVKDTSSFDTVDEYRKDISDRIEKEKERQAEKQLENDILKQIADGVNADIPAPMVEEQLDYFVQEFSYKLMYQGMKMDDYFKFTGTTVEDFRKEREQEAKNSVKMRLIVEEIIKQEKLEVTDAELEAKYEKYAEEMGKSIDEYKKMLSDRQAGYIKNEMLIGKLMDFLKENSVITSKQIKKPAKKAAKKADKE